jgi:hypothetical protein
MFSLILYQALLMSKLSSELSKAADLFEISTWYFSLTSTSSNFFRSNLNQNFALLIYLLKFTQFCHYQVVVSITVSSSEGADI